MDRLQVELRKRVGTFELDVAFAAEEGVLALFGRSGAGKSLAIGLIAGLVRPDSGRIVLDGRVLFDSAANLCLPSWRRNIGLVFQDSHLLPHLSVRHNLAFGRWFARGRRRIASETVVETLGIGHLLDRRPAGLSGGERQRVAIGRALLAAPDLLLLDEPFAALDAARTREILPLVERVRDAFSLPIVFVSHAVQEVARLAARVVVLEEGRVRAIGGPAAALGLTIAGDDRFEIVSVLTMRVGVSDADFGLTELLHPAGRVRLAGALGAIGNTLRVAIRATDVVLSATPPARSLSLQSVLSGHVASIEPAGALATVVIALEGGDRLAAAVTRRAVADLALAVGAPVHALVKTTALDERTIG